MKEVGQCVAQHTETISPSTASFFDDAFDPPEENRLYPELFRLHREVHRFTENLDDFTRLLEIQRELISAISEAEREIRAAKTANEDPKGWQYVRYNFLCLGDCLAFLYTDRFALKQTFFDVDTVNPRQSVGFLTGKAGHAAEISLLENAIYNNVPAVLCDITNVLRYGDICLLGEGDPVPIEVKSSKTKDSRSKRQKKKMKTLSSFFALDRGHGLRGLPGTTIRTAFSVPPQSYSDQLRVAIEQADKVGSTSFQVDGCLTVAVIKEDEPDIDALFAGFGSSRVLVSSVNEIKTKKMWGCYYPYALTLSKPNHFEGFVRGEIYIVTWLDVDSFEAKLALEGTRLSIEADENSIQCEIRFSNLFANDEDAYFFIGEHMMSRMWTDFLCPSWIVQNSISSVAENSKVFREAANGLLGK